MTTSSSDPESTSSNSYQSSLRALETALSAASLDQLALGTGKDAGYICKVRDRTAGLKTHEFVALLEVAGLKVVSRSQYTVNRERFEALATIASAAMADPEIARRLTMGE